VWWLHLLWKGRGFNRAAQGQIESWALAPEGIYFQPFAFPRRLKPHPISCFIGTAKAVPFQNCELLDRFLEVSFPEKDQSNHSHRRRIAAAWRIPARGSNHAHQYSEGVSNLYTF
jgi:hypothetical protein